MVGELQRPRHYGTCRSISVELCTAVTTRPPGCYVTAYPSLAQLVTSRPCPSPLCHSWLRHVLPPLLSATAGYVTSYPLPSLPQLVTSRPIPSPLCHSWLRHIRSRPTSLWLREKKRRSAISAGLTECRGCVNSVELGSHCLSPPLAPGLLTHAVSLDVEQHSVGCDVRSHAYQIREVRQVGGR